MNAKEAFVIPDVKKVNRITEVEDTVGHFIKTLTETAIYMVTEKGMCPVCNNKLYKRDLEKLSDGDWAVSCKHCEHRYQSSRPEHSAIAMGSQENFKMFWTIFMNNAIEAGKLLQMTRQPPPTQSLH